MARRKKDDERVTITAHEDGKELARVETTRGQFERGAKEFGKRVAKNGHQSKLFDMRKALGETLEPDPRVEQLTPEQRRVHAKGLLLEAREELVSCFKTMKELGLPSEAELERLICAATRCYSIVGRTGLAPQRADEKAEEKAERDAEREEARA